MGRFLYGHEWGGWAPAFRQTHFNSLIRSGSYFWFNLFRFEVDATVLIGPVMAFGQVPLVWLESQISSDQPRLTGSTNALGYLSWVCGGLPSPLQVSESGKYQIKLYDGRKLRWTIIEIDDYLPCTSWGGMTPQLIFSKIQEGKLCMALLEKAFAKLYGREDLQ